MLIFVKCQSRLWGSIIILGYQLYIRYEYLLYEWIYLDLVFEKNLYRVAGFEFLYWIWYEFLHYIITILANQLIIRKIWTICIPGILWFSMILSSNCLNWNNMLHIIIEDNVRLKMLKNNVWIIVNISWLLMLNSKIVITNIYQLCNWFWHQFHLDSDDERGKLLPSNQSNGGPNNNAEVFEEAISACGFGRFHIIVLFICGWAIASDSAEVQVTHNIHFGLWFI